MSWAARSHPEGEAAAVEWDRPRRRALPCDREALGRVNARLSLMDACRTGFWFCLECQRITELADGACGICGSGRVRHHLPILE